MLDVIDNTYNLRELIPHKNKMTIINYLDYVLNKNMNYTDIINNENECSIVPVNTKVIQCAVKNKRYEIQVHFNTPVVSEVDDTQSSLNQVQTKQNIRRCGVIFIKDFVKNISDFHLNQENNPPDKIRKILFVKGQTGYYSFPKGRMQEGENNYKCASREVYEETGIKISEDFLKILPVLKVDNNIYFICNLNNLVFINGKLNFIIEQFGRKYTFNCDINKHLNFWNFNDKTKMDEFEVEEACWHTLDEIIELKANKDIRNVLKKLKRKVENKN